MAPSTVRTLAIRLALAQDKHADNERKVKRNKEKHTKVQQENKSTEQYKAHRKQPGDQHGEYRVATLPNFLRTPRCQTIHCKSVKNTRRSHIRQVLMAQQNQDGSDDNDAACSRRDSKFKSPRQSQR